MMIQNVIDYGILCVGGASLIYFRGYQIKRKAENLKSAIRMNDLKGLSELLEINTKKPLFVAVSGTVGSTTPFECEHSGFWCVFSEKKTKRDASAKCLLKEKEVPWFLEDNTGRVIVQGVKYAEGFYDCVGDFLEIGMPLTVVGEAVKYDNGAIVIKSRSAEEGCFMVFYGFNSLDKMISYLESRSNTFVNVSMCLATIGGLMCAIPLMIEAFLAINETMVSHDYIGKA